MSEITVKIKLNMSFKEYFSDVDSKKHSDIAFLINRGQLNGIYLIDEPNKKLFGIEPSFEYISKLINENETFNLYFFRDSKFFKVEFSNNEGLVELCVQLLDDKFKQEFSIIPKYTSMYLSFYLESALKLCEDFEILYFDAETAPIIIKSEGENIINFGKKDMHTLGRRFSLITTKKLIECKAWEWDTLNQNVITNFKTSISKLNQIAKDKFDKPFEFHSKKPIPEKIKSWLEEKNISFKEG